MINNRSELYSIVKSYYIPLMQKAARRYELREQYTIVDTVGYECTRLEELFRPMWGIAPFLCDEDFCIDVCGKKMHMRDYITKIIYEGTDEHSDKRFDKNVQEHNAINFANQAVTEIAAYLVTVKLARDILWDNMEKEKRDKIAKWILRWSLVALKDSWPNNHYWYPIICLEILRQLGYYDPCCEEYIEKGFRVLDGLYVGHGWYSDGSFGRFDYYEAWAHHAYTLLWTIICDDDSEEHKNRCERYRRRSEEYIDFFSHYFDCDGGMVAYGRSLSYRFAAVSVFGLAALAGCDIDYGMAKSIILKNISYFFENSIKTEDGCFPCGYLYSSTRFSESYSSEGANCCYTEGFMCLIAGEDNPLWRAECKKLPIEKGDYLIECALDGLDILVAGENEHNGVTLYNNSIHYFQNAPHRFNDMKGYYSKFAYNSRAGFAVSTADNTSYDNMISLSTEKGTMCSHRGEIHGVSSEKDMLVSYHFPFENDKATKIMSATIPLSGGYHVRAHKVELSQSYIVREGGFSVGLADDGVSFDGGAVRYRGKVSSISAKAGCDVSYVMEKSAPATHNLQPLSVYPAYQTELLSAGEYIFAATVYYGEGEGKGAPSVEIDGNTVTVRQGEFVKTVTL